MTTVYIIRHGETDSNIRHTCIGHKDIELNENGKMQAHELCQRLSEVHFDAIYSSPLTRAISTITPYGKAPVIMNYALIERDFGDWDDLTFEEIKSANPDEYQKWLDNWIDYVIPNGESSAQVQSRVNDVMDKITVNHKGGTIAVVTHLGTARHIISHLLGLSIEQSWLFTFENAKYAVIEIDDEGKALLKGLNL